MKFYDLSKKISFFISELSEPPAPFTLNEALLVQELSILEMPENISSWISLLSGASGAALTDEQKQQLKILESAINKTRRSASLSAHLTHILKKIHELVKPKQSELVQAIDGSEDLDDTKKQTLKQIIQSATITGAAPAGEQAPVAAMRRDYAGQFSESEYQKLLVYCQLAFVFEENGIAEEHALKLAILFGNAKKAIDTLDHYARQTRAGGATHNKDGHYLHDACLFTLPDAVPANWDKWRTLLQDNFTDATLRKMFVQAPEIVAYFSSNDCKEFDMDAVADDELKAKLIQINESKKIDEIRKAILTVRAEIAKAKIMPAVAGTREAEVRKALLSNKNQQLDTLLQYYAVVCNENKILFQDLDKDAISGIYNKYLLTSSKSYSFLIKAGLNRATISKFLSLDRSHAGTEIPNLLIQLAAYPEYYLRKLDVIDNELDAAKGACLGKLTDCCQSIGDAGGECAIYGLTSAQGGFYVLCKKASAQSAANEEQDVIVAQSWVWRSENDGLVIDSIEFNNCKYSNKLVIDFYEAMARALHQEHHILDVYVGTSGQTPERIGYSVPGIIALIPKDYSGYRDSKKQRILISQVIPYLPQADGLSKEERKQKAGLILVRILSNFSLSELANHPLIHCLVSIVLERKKDDPADIIEEYFDKLPPALNNKLLDLITTNKNFLTELEKKPVDIEHIKQLCCQGAILNMRWKSICSDDDKIFHKLVVDGNASAVLEILQVYPPQQWLSLVNLKTTNKTTLLYTLANNRTVETFGKILEIYPQTERLKALKEQKLTYFNLDTLTKIAESQELIEVTMDMLSPADQKIFVQEGFIGFGKRENSVPLQDYRILDNINAEQLVNKILPLLSKEEWFELLQKKDSKGNGVIHYIAKKEALLSEFLGLFSSAEWQHLMQIKDEQGATVLHHIAHNDKLLDFFLKLLPDDDLHRRSAPLQAKNAEGLSVLHLTVSNPDALALALATYKDDAEKISAIEGDGVPLLAMAVTSKNTRSVQIILSLYPAKDRLRMAQSKFNPPLLHLATCHVETLKVILDLYPSVEEKMAAIKEKDKEGKTLLSVTKNIESLRYILNLYPETERLALLKETDSVGFSLLAYYTHNAEAIKFILEYYPPHERLAAILQENRYGSNVISHAIYYPNELQTMLELLPTNNLLQAITQYDSKGKGNSLLFPDIHGLYHDKKEKLIQLIFKLTPHEHHASLLNTKNQHGRTLLQHYATDPNLMVLLLKDYYKPEERLSALLEKDSRGHQILDELNYRYQDCLNFLDLLVAQEQLVLINTPNHEGETLTHKIFNFNESMRHKILAIYPSDEERVLALSLKNKKGFTVLDKAYSSSFLAELIKYYKPEQRLAAILSIKPLTYESEDHPALLHEPLFLQILKLLPEINRIDMLKKTYNCTTVLHKNFDNPAALKRILECLPKEHVYAAVNVTNSKQDNQTLLDLILAGDKSKSLQVIFDLLPEEQLTELQSQSGPLSVKISDYLKQKTALSSVRFFGQEERTSRVAPERNADGTLKL